MPYIWGNESPTNKMTKITHMIFNRPFPQIFNLICLLYSFLAVTARTTAAANSANHLASRFVLSPVLGLADAVAYTFSPAAPFKLSSPPLYPLPPLFLFSPYFPFPLLFPLPPLFPSSPLFSSSLCPRSPFPF